MSQSPSSQPGTDSPDWYISKSDDPASRRNLPVTSDTPGCLHRSACHPPPVVPVSTEVPPDHPRSTDNNAHRPSHNAESPASTADNPLASATSDHQKGTSSTLSAESPFAWACFACVCSYNSSSTIGMISSSTTASGDVVEVSPCEAGGD